MDGLDLIQRLQLRYAGGKYYLIDNDKAGMPYHKPIAVNKTGADIFWCLSRGMNQREAAEKMAGEFGIATEYVEKDLNFFLAEIERKYEVWD